MTVLPGQGSPQPQQQPQQQPQNLPPLPEQWEQAVTPEGEVYFINHANKTTSWYDPRLTPQQQQPHVRAGSGGSGGGGGSGGNSPTPNQSNLLFQMQQVEKQRRQQRLQQQQFIMQHQQQRINNGANSNSNDPAAAHTTANNNTNTTNSLSNTADQMNPLMNQNSLLNNLVREKMNQQQQQQQQQQMNQAGMHGRVESVDSGLDGMGMGMVDGMGSIEDVDMEGNQPLGKDLNVNRLPEFFDSMQGTDVDLGILETDGSDIPNNIEEMSTEVLNDVDMILNNANQKGEGFLTWL